jgi:hypothetical protein
MDDDDLPNDGWPIHDPVFHDRLHHTMDHRSLQNGLYDLSLDYAALNNGTNDVPLEDSPLNAPLVVVVFREDLAASRSIVKRLIIIVQRISFAELRGSRN